MKDSKFILSIRVSAIAMLAQCLLSHTLWTNIDRSFPLMPFFESFSFNFGNSFAVVTALMGGVLLIGTAFLPSKFMPYTVATTLLLLGFVVLQDAMRLQIWVYMYFLIFVIFLISHFYKKEKVGTWALRVLLAGVYFWSGTHKFNIHYKSEVFEWFTGIFALTKPLGQSDAIVFLTALVEVLLGISLLIPRIWKWAFTGTLSLHILILTFLVADHWNVVVYPWNIGMAILVYLALKPSDANTFSWKHPAVIFAIVTTGILPGLFIIDKIPTHFSFSMYSGRGTEAVLFYDLKDRNCIPENALSEERPIEDEGMARIYLDDWSMKELKVPVYVNVEMYKRIGRDFCKCFKIKEYGGIEIHYYPFWDEERKEFFTCEKL